MDEAVDPVKKVFKALAVLLAVSMVLTLCSCGEKEALYQTYHFYIEDGKYIFSHERRENKEGPLTEDDVVSSGTMELTWEQWQAFVSWIKGGTVEETQVHGEGYTLTVDGDGSGSDGRPFEFASTGKCISFQMNCYNLAHSEE